MTYWKIVARNDYRARLLADRHYSRKHPGAPEFCPPGNNIVLLGLNDDALWVSHRPDPKANLSKPRQDGLDYWDNPYFRNESGLRASDLILEALAITVGIWRDVWPLHGFHSFVDYRKVTPVIRRSKPVYGWCFEKAGFELAPARTKVRGLYRYVFSVYRLMLIEPITPKNEQLSMFDLNEFAS